MQETTNSNITTHSIANSSESYEGYEKSYEDRESRGESRESRESRNVQTDCRLQKNSQNYSTNCSIDSIDSIDLEELITALESTDDQSCGYFDTKTGEIKWVYDFDPSLSDISSEEFEADEGNNRYIALPDHFEINEYHMMEAFAYD